jgi:hypothetical protein
MSRTNLDGKSIKLVLQWLLNRDITDADLAAGLDIPPSNYSRHKDDDSYPSYEELQKLGGAFGISGRMLQIAFGLRGLDELMLLDDTEFRQWIEQGGGNHPSPASTRTEVPAAQHRAHRLRYKVRKDLPGIDHPRKAGT